MRLATGIDLIEISRVEALRARYGARFLERVFTPQELADCAENDASLAARYAAKEAVSKALGTGIGAVTWREIEIVRGPQREPILALHGAAAAQAAELGLTVWSISLTHTGDMAAAMVVGIST
jgi:holo-[acyl-carrier protein] synthase